MRAELKRLHSPDVDDLRTFVPPDPRLFQVFVQAMIGPDGDDAAESFDLVVCSPEWIRQQAENGPFVGAHHIVVTKLDYNALVATIREFCRRCEGATWQQVAAKLSLLGRWEFDDYRE
jgi:hypothetical protein